MGYFEMCQNCLKWALTKPPTTRIPSNRAFPSRARAASWFSRKDNCVYCTVCAKKCPTGALLVNRAQKKWVIDRLRCINCGCCVEICPRNRWRWWKAMAARR